MDLDLRPLTSDEQELAFRLRAQAFSAEPDMAFGPDDPTMPAERRLGAFASGRMVGHLGVWELGQWYGERRVPMGGVAGVAIAPEFRGTGVGSALLRRSLEDMRARGEVLSVLYPATHVPYQRLGWETAGVWPRRSVPTAALRRLPRPATDTSVRPGTTDDLTAIGEVYRAWARTRPGMLDRSELLFRRNLAPEDGFQLYVAERGADMVGVAGYEHATWNETPGAFRIDGLDLIGLDLDAELALWQLVASHSSVAPSTRYVGAPEDPLRLLLPENDLREDPFRVVWMNRLVDAAGAVAARGYPAGVEVRVPLHVTDPQIPANQGEAVLEVSSGRGSLTPGGDGRVRLDIGALSCLYTGYLSARELAHLGRIRGGDPADLAALEAAFTGTTPWMRDYF